MYKPAANQSSQNANTQGKRRTDNFIETVPNTSWLYSEPTRRARRPNSISSVRIIEEAVSDIRESVRRNLETRFSSNNSNTSLIQTSLLSANFCSTTSILVLQTIIMDKTKTDRTLRTLDQKASKAEFLTEENSG